jgi:hypothetical protein
VTRPVVADVTARIAERSAEQRRTYLERMAAPAENGPARGRLACANLAHGFAASDTRDKSALRRMVKPTSRSCRPTTTSSRRVGGSWLTPADAIDRHDWAKISSMAAVAAELAKAAAGAASAATSS